MAIDHTCRKCGTTRSIEADGKIWRCGNPKCDYVVRAPGQIGLTVGESIIVPLHELFPGMTESQPPHPAYVVGVDRDKGSITIDTQAPAP